MIAFHKDWVSQAGGVRTRVVRQQTPLVGPAWLRKLLGHVALIQSMDEQLAAWDAASATGLYSLHAFVSLDGKRMLPCARVEWRIAPLPSTSGCGARVEARVACWAERFAYVGLQGAVESALLSMAVSGTAAFNAHCESVFKEQGAARFTVDAGRPPQAQSAAASSGRLGAAQLRPGVVAPA